MRGKKNDSDGNEIPPEIDLNVGPNFRESQGGSDKSHNKQTAQERVSAGFGTRYNQLKRYALLSSSGKLS
jgi:hypothetical protein